ncbi:hypothetical protein Ancab_001983, partial [Ancistrocladus abbreviatus]
MSGANIISVFWLALSGLARSNEVLNAGYFCFWTMHQSYNAIFVKKHAYTSFAVQFYSKSLLQPAVYPPRPPGHLQRLMQITGMSHLPLQPPLLPQHRPQLSLPNQLQSLMGPNMRSQHPGLPQPHHSQPPFHIELQASKQREAALEAALAEKEFAEEECRKKVDKAKKREASLENNLANMWVLVAKLKKEGGAIPDSKSRGCHR